jgi:hypothetical protein
MVVRSPSLACAHEVTVRGDASDRAVRFSERVTDRPVRQPPHAVCFSYKPTNRTTLRSPRGMLWATQAAPSWVREENCIGGWQGGRATEGEESTCPRARP